MTDTIDSFRGAIRSSGLEAPDIIEPDKLHRFPGNGKGNGNKAGWCKLFADGLGGVFGDWSQDFTETWQAKREKPFTDAERKAFKDKCEREKQARQAELDRQHAKVAETAAAILIGATGNPATHPYALKKKVSLGSLVKRGAWTQRTWDDALLVPIYGADGTVWSIQAINTDGIKDYLKGGRVSGCYHAIGEPDGTLCICEGYATAASVHEATGHAAVAAFSAGNLGPVARALRGRYPDTRIIICADDDVNTENNPGVSKATEAAQSVDGLLAVPDFGDDRPDGATDFNDLHRERGLDAVRRGVDREHAPQSTNCSGCSASPDAGASVVLLDDLRDFIRRFCVFPDEHALTAVSLWAAHAHMIESFHITPRLALLSPEPSSGKSRVLEILDLLTPEAMLTINASPASIFRSLENRQITLLFDEIDAIFNKRGKDDAHEDLRALINAGYKRGATIPRCVGPRHEVTNFPVFCAVALAGLGDLPDTIMSRSVIIRMRRRAPSEKVEEFRTRRNQPQGHELRDQLASWAEQVGAACGDAWPTLPPGIMDRPAEIWEPLIAVADAAGGHWSQTVRDACISLCRVADDRTVSLGIRLLSDLRIIFGDTDAFYTQTILRWLTDSDKLDADAPWADLYGKPLGERRLASMLKKYNIKSEKVRERGGRPLQGYRREHLWDAWQRYLPSPVPARAEHPEQAEQVNGGAGSSVPDDVQNVPDVPDSAPTETYPERKNPATARVVPDVPDVPDMRESEREYVEVEV